MTQEPSKRTEPERSVSHFELFFDLVFVFSLTRVTALILEEPTAFGVLRGLLVLALLWWAWGAYAWLTNAVETNGAAARVVVLAAMGAMLVVAVAVPQASGRDALAFALGYLVVRVLHLVLYAVAGGANRAAILRLAPGNLFASVLLIVGVFLPVGVQVALWGVAVLVDYGTPLITGVSGFSVHAGHFFERHALFMIIALGESVVAVGLGVLHGNAAITLLLAVAVMLALGTVGGMWWAYFDWEAGLNRRELFRVHGASRAHLARDLFSYLHLPLVTGVVFVAVGLEGVMQHPLERLHGIHQISLGGGAALFLLGLGAVRSRRGHRARLDHVLGGLVCLGLIPVAALLPAIVALVVLLAVLMVIALVDRTRQAEPTAAAGDAIATH